ncbi:diguanylate cyclase (GGDEF)-like protein [Desulfobotulus alkaliphilus]|uniref:diguanylate cyclase n=1 Tax=Desulfobotulus alkaliphilus TaxID=622671 RepID=A0A562S839_9BACT|nr:diguanylate cyclase [Desulfobotulus alkaliphilus]TWI77488.1 diguanylate cyclase (GGDEF)-like protein [Desulfobotulus alkaliphilus]
MTENEDQRLFESQMELLREGYREKLGQQMDKMTGLLENLEKSLDPLPALETLGHELHKIAGGAGIFGMPELGKKARTLEIQMKGIRERAALGQEVPVSELRTAIGALHVPESLPDPEAPLTSPLPERSSGKAGAGDVEEPGLLIIDPDDKRGRELVLALRYFGYIPKHCAKLSSAAALFPQRPPHAILLSLSASENFFSVTALAEEIREVFPQPPPLMVLSDSLDFSTRLAVARAGGQGFFIRPLDVPKVVDRLEQLIGRREMAPYRVLIVDDEPMVAEHFCLVLQAAGMEVQREEDAARVLDMLSTFRPELILMDVHMEGCSGTELAGIIRMEEEWVGIPILYLSAESKMEEQIRALNSGGDDFLTKPVDDAYLVASVSAHVSRARRLAELMAKDSLTGLLKHIRIKEALEVEMSRSNRDGSTLCVVMLDLDHFKRVNDTWGHATGDRVIKALAHLLTRRLRRSDSIGRYGGEEFMAVLPGCTPEKAEILMEEIRKNLKTIEFHAKEEVFNVTCSIGIACSSLGSSPEEVLQAADQALYRAKEEGRDRICIR